MNLIIPSGFHFKKSFLLISPEASKIFLSKYNEIAIKDLITNFFYSSTSSLFEPVTLLEMTPYQ